MCADFDVSFLIYGLQVMGSEFLSTCDAWRAVRAVFRFRVFRVSVGDLVYRARRKRRCASAYSYDEQMQRLERILAAAST